MGSTFFLTGAGNVLGDVGNDISGFFTGPPGDPGRIRQIADRVDALHAEFTRAALALDDAVLTLTQSWTGTASTSFSNAWCACTKDSPSTVLSTLAGTLTQFSRQLRDYADTLEHAQHEHWIQLGLMAALTIVNVAQLGADPVTDAAEVGVGAGMEVAAGLSLSGLGDLALSGAMAGLEFDTISQLGADLLDRTDPQFDQTGDGVVPLFDPQEAAESAIYGALYELGDGLGGGLGEGDPLSSLTDDDPPATPGDDPPADPQSPDDTPGSTPTDTDSAAAQTPVATEGAPTLLSAGGGSSSSLPMSMDTVSSVADKYGLDISDSSIRINKSVAGLYGSTAPDGSITLYRGAFANEEQLAKTLFHEQFHVGQLQAGMPYPASYNAASAWEQAAEAAANEWWSRVTGR
jgi:uncharacterized protein YukE